MDIAGVTLDFARCDEAAELAAMSRDLVEAGLGWHYRPEVVRELLADEDIVTLVARQNDAVIGFAVMTYPDDCAHLVLLAIAPGVRRRGLGRRMVEWLIETAVVDGAVSVRVELRADNRPAYRLYRSLGFTETVRIGGYYRGVETAVKMLRLLRDPRTRPPAAWKPPRRGGA